ncbi:MAG TPA: polysaccharide biosynthesis tyrosine autokinase [Candidatus Cybelea sp.]|nr:polysaccharide biosynthesis tyrosine autokinase [Candidatus Cybelea sp.]
MNSVSLIDQRPSEHPDEPQLMAIEPGPAGRELSLREILQTIWRRRWLIIATVFLACTLTTLWVLQIVPRYVATAAVVVETRHENVLKIESVLQGMSPDYYTNETEAAIIRSRDMAGRVVDQLDLVSSPLFNPDLAPERTTLASRLEDLFDVHAIASKITPQVVKDLIDQLRPQVPDAGGKINVPIDEKTWTRDRVIDRFMASTKVEPGERSRVITIQFTTEDPQLAALAANTLAEIYIRQSVSAKNDATANASDWLNDRVSDMRRRVAESSQAVDAYRRQAGIVDVQNQTTLLQQQLAELNTKLVTSRSERAEAEARYQQVERMVNSPGGINASAAVLQSPLIQKLREQEAQVVREMAELRSQLKEDHPQMILKRSELADLDDKIGKEVAKVGSSLKSELEIARIRERSLANDVADLQQKIAQQNEAQVQLHALESEANANKQLYDTMLARFKETGVQEKGVQQADARLISPAAVPTSPAYPKKGLILSVAFVASALVALLLVFIVEHMDAGFRTLQQVEAVLGVPGIGMVPRISNRKRRGGAPADHLLASPNSVYAEAIRTIRTGLLLSNVDRPPKTVLVTSSLPGEGKSGTALSLARAAAKAGQRTIIIDCDLRHPTLHVNLGVANKAGVVEAVSGIAKLEDVVEIDERSGCHFMTAGTNAPSPTDLLGSEAMRRMLARLKEVYDLVIVDTPPVLVVSDALVLLRLVDKTLFMVRWGKTRREAAQIGVRDVLQANADLAGVVLNEVDLRKSARYQYGDATSYGNYRKYYID